jgi:hypothetical protein
MSWPQATQYNEAIQNLRSSMGDEELRFGEPAVNALGVPMPSSGNFADVYQIRCPRSGNAWAVKCFTREIPGLRQRYRAISEQLDRDALPFAVDFSYLEQGIRIAGNWYPILKMRWVEGLRLNQFAADYLDRPKTLKLLLSLWVKLAARLRGAGIAHADLQHGNILLVPVPQTGQLSLKLIDYDGMYVPPLAGQRSGEVGHPAFQHPQRIREGIYSAEVDRFSHLVIYLAIQALADGGQPLWDRFDNGDNLLFRESDFASPETSELLQDLWRQPDPDTHALAGRLVLACKGPLATVPWIEDLVVEGRVRPLAPGEEQQVTALMNAAHARIRSAPRFAAPVAPPPPASAPPAASPPGMPGTLVPPPVVSPPFGLVGPLGPPVAMPFGYPAPHPVQAPPMPVGIPLGRPRRRWSGRLKRLGPLPWVALAIVAVAVAVPIVVSHWPPSAGSLPSSERFLPNPSAFAGGSSPIPVSGELVPLDLSPQFTRALDRMSSNSQSEGNWLSGFPRGETVLGGVRFRIGQGLLVLGSPQMPDAPRRVGGIAINSRISRLHVLHASQWSAAPHFPVDDGAAIGYYQLNYADGSNVRFPIAYGVDVRDWWAWDRGQLATPRGRIVWTGSNAVSRAQQVDLRMFAGAYENPYPERPVASIDFVSTEYRSAAPFCLAMTIERMVGSDSGTGVIVQSPQPRVPLGTNYVPSPPPHIQPTPQPEKPRETREYYKLSNLRFLAVVQYRWPSIRVAVRYAITHNAPLPPELGGPPVGLYEVVVERRRGAAYRYLLRPEASGECTFSIPDWVPDDGPFRVYMADSQGPVSEVVEE